MSIFSILGFGNGKVKEALRHGAVIIDVRTAHEFDQGKVSGSINIPIDRININLQRIRQMPKPVIVCSGSDSETEKAIAILKTNGIKEVYNGGRWTRILRMSKSL
jgi:rhodanese-related sulfurtransferase